MSIKGIAASAAIVAAGTLAGMGVGEVVYRIDETPSTELQQSEIDACARQLGETAIIGEIPKDCERYNHLFPYNVQTGSYKLMAQDEVPQYVEIVRENPDKHGNLITGLGVVGLGVGAGALVKKYKLL